MARTRVLIASLVVAEGTVIGYWDKTWAPGAAPQGATLGVAFNGWADPQNALSASASVKSSLVGKRYISIGGGNGNGAFTLARVQDLEAKLKAGAFSDWEGLSLDVEECHGTGLGAAFTRITAAAKSKGMETMVTVSHSQPYGCGDAAALMSGFFADPNLDYISPQLYTSGGEASPDFTAVGTGWEQYASSKAKLIPSIVDHSHYAAVSQFFAGKGSTVQGYVQWKAGNAPAPAPKPSPSPSPSDCRCSAPENCYVSGWAVPCFQAQDAVACASHGGKFCGDAPVPAPRPSPSPSTCGCSAPDNCYVSGWAVPCFQAKDAVACASHGGSFCSGTAEMLV